MGAIIAAIVFKKKLTSKVLLGLFLGTVGVAILVGFDPIMVHDDALFAVIAAVLAAVSYGVGTTYTQTAPAMSPEQNAHGSMWGASAIILPMTWMIPINEPPSTEVISAVIFLGVICTAAAYLIFFRLIAEIGASSTLTVTFLIPVFGILWGALFLGEQVGLHTLVGSIVTMTGTVLVTGFSIKQILPKAKIV